MAIAENVENGPSAMTHTEKVARRPSDEKRVHEPGSDGSSAAVTEGEEWAPGMETRARRK